MNRKLKSALQKAFEVPKPMKKDDFLRELNYPKTQYKDFFISQIGYVRKRVWCFSVLLLMLIIILTGCMDSGIIIARSTNLFSMISASLPFLALLSVTEISRALFYRMDELEMSCRYSLSHLVIARATILGIGNLVILIAVIAVVGGNNVYGYLRVSQYLLLPYLTTCVGSILILNHGRGRESLYWCGAVACFISIMVGFLSATKQIIYEENLILIWIGLCVACVILIIVQMSGFIKRMGEIQWNLLLTD